MTEIGGIESPNTHTHTRPVRTISSISSCVGFQQDTTYRPSRNTRNGSTLSGDIPSGVSIVELACSKAEGCI